VDFGKDTKSEVETMRKLVDDVTLQNAYMQAIEIIENVGVRFESEAVRELFKERGARVEGDKVFVPCHLLEEALATTPKQDYSVPAQKRVIAATPFSNAPFILDDDTGAIRRCNIADAIKMYQINETSSLYECTNPGCADPVDNDAPDQFVAQVAMALKYSDKYPSIGLRATKSTSHNADVYDSARRAFRLVREFYDVWDEPVMTQGICPNPPLAYDQECLDNLCAAIDEQQAISIFPCSLGFMTGPESIMGIVIHDFAMSLAGLAFIQLKSPGHPTSLSNFSTISNVQTLQPNYGSAECVFIQVIFYELCKFLSIPCVICGSYGDGTAVDYQAGMEAMLTTMLPFSLTEVNEVWCYPGILAAFACGSFHKAILDEEMMRYSNRVLQGVEMTVDSELPGLLAAGQQANSFLYLGSMDTYRRDNYLTKTFNKWGIAHADNTEKTNLAYKVQQVLGKRIAAYQLPERSAAQKKLLQPYLPSLCQY
jgi:trimethylamine---corrinoid protein Co-methyltransferase